MTILLFFLWLTPAEEGSQARSHKITLTEFIRLTLDDKHSIYVYITHLSKRSLKSNNIPTNVCQLLERTQFSKGLSINQKILHENIQISTYSAQN